MQITHNSVLLFNRDSVGFYQSITKICDIFIFTAFSIQWIESDPCSDIRIVVAKNCTKIIFAIRQIFQQFSGSPVTAAGIWKILSVLIFPTVYHIAHVLLCLKQSAEICADLFHWIPLCKQRLYWKCLCLARSCNGIVLSDVIVPAESSGFFRGTLGTIAVFQCHVYNCSGSDRVL